jgi:hypothetical protein
LEAEVAMAYSYNIHRLGSKHFQVAYGSLGKKLNHSIHNYSEMGHGRKNLQGLGLAVVFEIQKRAD